MAQVISHWPVIVKVWVQSQASQCEIWGGQSCTGTCFPISIIPQVLHACSFIYHPLQYEQLAVSLNTMHFSGNCLCLILIKCTCAMLNYKHKLRKIPAKYWQREVTVENHVLFFFPTYLVEPGSAGHQLDPVQLGFQDHHQGLQCHPPSSNLHQNNKKEKNWMTWNFPLPWIPINIVFSKASLRVSQTTKYIAFLAMVRISINSSLIQLL